MVAERLDQLLTSSCYVSCPGLRDYPHASVRFTSKNVRLWGTPFERVDSVKCEMSHIPQNWKIHPKHHLYNMCASCKKVTNRIDVLRMTNEGLTEEARKQRQTSSSTYPIQWISPKSQKARCQNVLAERKLLKEKVQKYKSEWRHKLSDEQSMELAKIMKVIEMELPDDLRKVLEDVEKQCPRKAELLRREWEQDQKDHLDFYEDQAKNGK